MHLLTQQAVRLYKDKLAEHGLLLFHVTNRRLDLPPVVANLAGDAGLVSYIWDDQDIPPEDQRTGYEPTQWIVLARHTQDLAGLTTDPHWRSLAPDPRVALWSDDFSSILAVLRWKQ